jgi:hypothetical protein
MSTVAIACAKDEGMDIVTDEGERKLSNCLATQDADGVYDAWLHPKEPAGKDRGANAQQILEIIVYQHCDPSKVTAETLSRLSSEREAIAALHDELQKVASTIPEEISNDDTLKERLEDGAQQALTRWSKDRVNLSALGKEVFGFNGVKDAGKLIEELAKKAATPEIGGSTASGIVVGGLNSGTLLGAAAGFAVGIVIHALSSWHKVRQREATSPYRYLTMLEKGGVAFTIGK